MGEGWEVRVGGVGGENYWAVNGIVESRTQKTAHDTCRTDAKLNVYNKQRTDSIKFSYKVVLGADYCI